MTTSGMSPRKITLVQWMLLALAHAGLWLLAPIEAVRMVRLAITHAIGLMIALSLPLWFVRRVGGGLAAWTVSALFCGFFLWLIDVVVQAQASMRTLHWPPAADFHQLRFNLIYYDLLFFLQAAILTIRDYYQTVQLRDRQLAEAALATQEARLAALRFQLNPHFLFNTLNAIASIVSAANVPVAELMIVRLSDFLRASLDSAGQELVTLDQELETTAAYLDIEMVRFGDRVTIGYDCEERLGNALVPVLILQPLVENAVKHAVTPSTGAVAILLRAVREQDALVLYVEDDGREGPAAATTRTGVGLHNVAARLEALYGSDAGLDAGPRGNGFVACIRMPLRFAE